MRTLVDIPDVQLGELGAICKAKHLSRAEVIRRAVAAYIERNRPAPEQAFGLWRDDAEDGVAYQERMRSEW